MGKPSGQSVIRVPYVQFTTKLTPGPIPVGWSTLSCERGPAYARRDGLQITVARNYERDGAEVRTGGVSHPSRMPTEEEVRFAAREFLGVARGHFCLASPGTVKPNYVSLEYRPAVQRPQNDVLVAVTRP